MRKFRAVPGRGIVASTNSSSERMYDNYRKSQLLLSDSDYNYINDMLEAELEDYLQSNDYEWWSEEDGKQVIPEVRFRPSKELKSKAASLGYKIVKSRSKYVPDYEYYVIPVDD